MKKLSNNTTSRLVLLACTLFASCGLQAGIINLSSSSGPISFGSATPALYAFADFGGSYQATWVTATLTGLSTGGLTLVMGGSADYNSNGDRLLLSLTNNTGSALSGIQLNLSGTTFDLVDGIDPSRGTFSSDTYTSNFSQRLSSPDVSATSSQVTFTFDAILADGATTTFYLPVADIAASQITTEALTFPFTLSETPTASGVPEPATLGLMAAALIGLGLAKRRRRNF